MSRENKTIILHPDTTGNIDLIFANLGKPWGGYARANGYTEGVRTLMKMLVHVPSGELLAAWDEVNQLARQPAYEDRIAAADRRTEKAERGIADATRQLSEMGVVHR